MKKCLFKILSIVLIVVLFFSCDEKIKKVENPELSIAGGSYNDTFLELRITCATPDVIIYYTLDASNPHWDNGIRYEKDSIIEIKEPLTIKVIAHKTDYEDSDIVSASYVVATEAPIFFYPNTIFEDFVHVDIHTPTENALIYFTTDGTDPLISNENFELNYTAVLLSESCTLKAIAHKEGYNPSALTSQTFTKGILAPEISPNGGVFDELSLDVYISCMSFGVEIYYTLDGTMPSKTNGFLINSGDYFTLNESSTVKAIAYKEGFDASEVVSADFFLGLAKAEFSPNGGEFFQGAIEVEIASIVDNGKIYYTLDGTTPSKTNGTLIESGASVEINESSTLKAVVIKDGFNDSEISSADFYIEKFTTVKVEAGSFQMGSNEGGYGLENYKPAHQVTLTKNFYISPYLVTQKEFEELMGASPWSSQSWAGVGDNHPAHMVSWFAAITYCNKLSIKEGLTPVYEVEGVDFASLKFNEIPVRISWQDEHGNWQNNLDDPIFQKWHAVTCDWNASGYRLPTEAEWEFAARGGNLSQGYLYSGSNNLADVAWYSYPGSENNTQPVGGKEPNELGIYDMTGNVWEWCWDWEAEYTSDAQTDPKGPEEAPHYGYEKILRGPSFEYEVSGCPVFVRYYESTYAYSYSVGFRIVRG